MVEAEGLRLLSQPDYSGLLVSAGFEHVTVYDRTNLLEQTLQQELQRLRGMQRKFVSEFSQEDYKELEQVLEGRLARCVLTLLEAARACPTHGHG